MLKEFEERITNAKNKQFRMLERFHIGDAVYPFWLKGIIVYGIVTDVDTVARKVFCDFNGVRRQFCPEDLMHVNPELINTSTAKKRNASADGAYSKFDDTQLSPDTDNGISATCKKCGGEIAVSYDEKTATSDFVCTKCGHRIPEDKLNSETKKAMRLNQQRNIKASGIVAEDEGYVKLSEAFDALLKKYPKNLDYDMGWKQDIMNGVIYINYYSGFEDDGFEVTFNVEYHDGKFSVEAVDLDGTSVVGPDSYDSLDAMVNGFKSYFPTVKNHVKDLVDKENGDYYDADHAAEWMEKNPHGWYNSENDYGTGNEDDDDRFASKKAIAQELARVAKMLIRRD